MKVNKTLIIFCVTYNLITLNYVWNVQHDPSDSLGYIYIFPIFWLMAGIALIVLFRLKKAALQTRWDKWLLFFSTPLPLLMSFFIVAYWPANRLLTSTYEYNKDGHRHREIRYDYSIGHRQRVEYYISRDTVTDSTPFPPTEAWLKDSEWLYYKKDGSVEKKEDYRKRQ